MFVQILVLNFLLTTSIINCSGITKNTQREIINEAVFMLSIADTSLESNGKIETGDYTLSLTGAYIMTGAYDGLFVEFEAVMVEYTKLKLSFKLPSCDRFKMYPKSKSVEYEIPELPFKLTEKDFEGIWSDRIENFITPNVELQRRFKRATTHIDYVHFKSFEMYVTEFNIKINELNMSCTFSGEVINDDLKYTNVKYELKGNFDVSDYDLGYMEID